MSTNGHLTTWEMVGSVGIQSVAWRAKNTVLSVVCTGLLAGVVLVTGIVVGLTPGGKAIKKRRGYRMSEEAVYIIKTNIDERYDFLNPDPNMRFFGINIVLGVEGQLDERLLRDAIYNLAEEAVCSLKREYGLMSDREPE